jgi:hypothetical protein
LIRRRLSGNDKLVAYHDAPDHDLEALLDLNGWSAEIGGGFWVSVVAFRVPPDQGRPRGINYSLTLHRPGGERILGYDNAHYPPIGGGPARKVNRAGRAHDHRHQRDRISWYGFDTAAKLMGDFWDDARNLLEEEGVPWME